MKFKSECNGNVLIFEDFLTIEEIELLNTFMKDFDYDNLMEHEFKYWGKRLINQYQMNLNPGYENVMDGIMPTLNDIILRTIDTLNEHDHPAEWAPSPHNLIKMFSNSSGVPFGGDDYLEMFVHVDNQAHMESPIMWGCVVYLNDNYEGGEIYYPDYNYSYKPKPGSMVLHEGNTRHGVKKVLSGDRFCMASLVTINGNWNQNPLPARTDNPESPYHYPAGYNGKRMSDDPIQGDICVPRIDGTTAPYNSFPKISEADGV